MKLETKKLLHKYGTPINFLVILGLIVVVAIEVHWSVALLFAWMGYSISSFASGVNKFRADLLYKIKAVKDYAMQNQKTYEEFIGTVNKQAEDFKKKGAKCIECEKYPGQIRPESIHNSADTNCQLYQQPPFKEGDKIQVPPELLKEDNRPRCKKCEADGLPDLYYHNNCPIHN